MLRPGLLWRKPGLLSIPTSASSLYSLIISGSVSLSPSCSCSSQALPYLCLYVTVSHLSLFPQLPMTTREKSKLEDGIKGIFLARVVPKRCLGLS